MMNHRSSKGRNSSATNCRGRATTRGTETVMLGHTLAVSVMASGRSGWLMLRRAIFVLFSDFTLLVAASESGTLVLRLYTLEQYFFPVLLSQLQWELTPEWMAHALLVVVFSGPKHDEEFGCGVTQPSCSLFLCACFCFVPALVY